MPKLLKLTVTSIILITIISLSQPVLAHDWIPVRGGIPFGISGMALLNQNSNILDLLIVHDNKKANQGRLAIIRITGKNQPEYIPLQWTKNLEPPIDLEALTAIPGKNNSEFLALASAGKAYHLKFDLKTKSISVLKAFDLPGIQPNSNFESLSLQNIDGKIVAAWAHRGEGEKPSILDWGIFDLAKYQIKLVGSANFTVPFPSGNVRHISDLKIDNAGVVYISSASDAGDDGPFQSAVYVAGYLGWNGNKIVWKPNQQLFPIYRDNYHKIEGLELIPGATGGVIVGTDDENMGSSVYIFGQ
jgi:hypothetical protein